MKNETHTPDWQDPNEIAAFVRHSSSPNNSPADQQMTDVSPPHEHPDLGQVVTIQIIAAKDGGKANKVILHLPIKTLANWVSQSLPDIPKVGADPADVDMSLDLADINLGAGK